MDELNKQQIVLLTLLVSFVTSIATGITTVSLVTQADTPTVTQTINRVVEKTIEKVVPEEQDTITVIKTPEKEVVTVVVNEEDLTVDSVNTNAKSLVRIYEVNRSQRNLVALAVVIDGSGVVIANESFFSRNRNFVGVYQGAEYEMEALYQSSSDPIIAMKPIIPEGTESIAFTPVKFGDVKTAQLGQSVIALGGRESNSVNTGIISSIDSDEESVNSITTSINVATTLGSILINLKGEMLGMNIGQYQTPGIYTPTTTIITYIQKALNGA